MSLTEFALMRLKELSYADKITIEIENGGEIMTISWGELKSDFTLAGSIDEGLMLAATYFIAKDMNKRGL